mmetsp:Transcript_49909/g.140704  ORF Transcript_49909/g.140704 Transcript_49909/m.140704 type:complete len:402 (+) Transcript_49909:417-1622(+)
MPPWRISCGGVLRVVLLRLLDRALRVDVHDGGERHGDDHEECWQVEGLLLEDPDEERVGHDDAQGLPDVLEEGVEDRDEVQRGVALDGEGRGHRERHPAPPCEGPVPGLEVPRLPVDEGVKDNRDDPGHLQPHQLHVDGVLLVLLHVLVREHRAEARDDDLEHDHADAEDVVHVHGPAARRRAFAAVLEVARGHVHAHRDHHRGQDGPLQAGLLRALDPPHHQRRDEELALQQHLVRVPADRREGGHLEDVADGVHDAEHGKDLHRGRVPRPLPLLHAAVREADDLPQEEDDEALAEHGGDLRVGRHGLPAALRHHLGGADDDRVQRARQHEEGEEGTLEEGAHLARRRVPRPISLGFQERRVPPPRCGGADLPLLHLQRLPGRHASLPGCAEPEVRTGSA